MNKKDAKYEFATIKQITTIVDWEMKRSYTLFNELNLEKDKQNKINEHMLESYRQFAKYIKRSETFIDKVIDSLPDDQEEILL